MRGKTRKNSEDDQSLEKVSLAITVRSQGIFRESVENTRGIRIRVMERKKKHKVQL